MSEKIKDPMAAMKALRTMAGAFDYEAFHEARYGEPSDAGEQITVEWLKTRKLPLLMEWGFVLKHVTTDAFQTKLLVVKARKGWGVYVGHLDYEGTQHRIRFHDLANRRDLLRLCDALGIEV